MNKKKQKRSKNGGKKENCQIWFKRKKKSL